MKAPDALLRAVHRPRVRLYAPRGWVADLLGQAPTIAAHNICDDYEGADPSELSAFEADALACAHYVIEVPASRWDHETVHPIKKRNRTATRHDPDSFWFGVRHPLRVMGGWFR